MKTENLVKDYCCFPNVLVHKTIRGNDQMITYALFLFVILMLMSISGMVKMLSFEKNIDINTQDTINYNMNYLDKTTISMVLAVIAIFLFSALRFNVGWDYKAYYETIKFNRETNIMMSNEYGTMFLVNLAKKISFPQIYFIINSFICVIFTAITVKNYSKDFWLSIVFFVCFPLFYLNSLSVIRNFTAIAIAFYAFKFIDKKQPIRYFITIIIASLFHKTALLALIFYFAGKIKFKSHVYVIAMGILPIISHIAKLIIERYIPRYSIYLAPAKTQEGTKAIYVLVFVALLLLAFKDRITKKRHNINNYFNIYFIGVFIYLMFVKQGTLGHRLSLYGTIYSLILIPDLLSVLKFKTDKNLMKIVFYGLCIVMFLYTVKIGSETYLPYKVFFAGH